MGNFSNFYNIYIFLCANKKVSPSRVAEEIGLTRTTANGWKKGKKPSDVSLRKIADYFGVTVDYLLGNEEQEKTPAPLTEQERLDEKVLGLLHQHSLDAQSAIIDLLARMAVKPEEK